MGRQAFPISRVRETSVHGIWKWLPSYFVAALFVRLYMDMKNQRDIFYGDVIR